MEVAPAQAGQLVMGTADCKGVVIRKTAQEKVAHEASEEIAGYPIASGLIEGACRHVVVDRREGSGMRWVMEGAQSMLGLRCLYLNGDWEHFMKFHIEQEQKALYPVRAANESSLYDSLVA